MAAAIRVMSGPVDHADDNRNIPSRAPLPGPNGLEVAEQARISHQYLPILFVTGVPIHAIF